MEGKVIMSKKVQIELFLLENIIWVIVVVFFLLNALFTPYFASYANIINIFYHSAIMSMLVLGLGLTIMVGKLDLSLESTLVFAPGLATIIITKWVVGINNPILLIILTLLVGGLAGYINGIFIAKIQVNDFLQTLSMMIILRGLALFLLPFSIYPLTKIVGRAFTFPGGGRIFWDIPVAIPIVIGIFIIFHFLLHFTPYGRRVMSTGGNARASFVSGIDIKKIVISIYILAGMLAAVAGILAAGKQDSISNSMGQGMILLAFAGAILGGASFEGGKGTALGMFGGALLLGMFSNSLNLLGVSVNLVYAAQGVLILLALVVDRIRIKRRSKLLQYEKIKELDANEKK